MWRILAMTVSRPEKMKHLRLARGTCQSRGALAQAVRLAHLYPPVYDEIKAEVAMKFTRITVDVRQMAGVPCIRALRIPVATVVGMVADGMTEAEILVAYPDLEHDDLVEALRYAADAVRERGLPLTVP
jgi:uncharacterized protein (DUF433 family)